MIRLLTLSLLLLAVGVLPAQDLSIAALTVPAELREDANSVVRSYDQVYESVSPSEATLKVRRVITLLNDDHDRENVLVVHYDDDTKITRIRATLYDALGTKIRNARKAEIEDYSAISGGQFYTDARVKVITLTHQTYPYTVEFEYELEMENFGAATSPDWSPQAFDQSTQQATFTAIVPASNELRYKAHALNEPEVTTAGGQTTLRWEVSDLTARPAESYAPTAPTLLPYLRTALRDFRIDDYELTNRDWTAFGQQMLALHENIRELPAPLAKLVEETTAGLTSDRERIAALYRLLQDRTRYVGVQLGIGGWQPFSADYVESNRYGDCKALSNYMGAMLDAAGIDNYPVLVNWNDRPYLNADPDFTATAFNHMILYVPAEDMYLECTSSEWPAGYLGDGKQDRNVLWLTPEGGKLVRTPAHRPGDHGHVRALDLRLDADGNADYALRAEFFGAAHEDLRMFLTDQSDRSKQLEVLERAEFIPNVQGKTFTATLSPDQPTVALAYDTRVQRYARKLGKRTFLPLNKFNRYESVPDATDDRQFPVVTTRARFLVDTVRLTLDEALEVESLGEPVTEIKHAAGEYRAEVITAPGQITWIRTLRLTPVELPAEEYAGFREFFVAVNKAERRQVVLREKRTK